jgi:hypothetical protein
MKVRNMETMANQDLLAIEKDDDGAIIEDRSKRVVTHVDPMPQDWVVGDKGRFVWNHVVGCS